MTTAALKIHSLFRLADGTTVIACDRPSNEISWPNRKVSVLSDNGEQRQELVVSGTRAMLRQSERLDQIAIETSQTVHLTDEEVQSGHWLIAFSKTG